MKILLTYFHRPMNVGLFFRRAFEQLGHDVRSAGPSSNEVYGHSNWAEYRGPDVDLPNTYIDVAEVLKVTGEALDGWQPDLLVEVDQYDHIVVIGKTDRGAWAHVSVENFNMEQYQRSTMRVANAEFYFIQHDDNGRTNPPPLPTGAEWMVFGADPEIHPLTKSFDERDKWVCQIGTHYEPRPTIWNALRWQLDGAQPQPSDSYGRNLHESEHTLFGKIFSYEGMAEAYNRSICALSCSNVDFVPMRIVEAFAMGCVLLSDDVPSMRQGFGDPWPENPNGLWVAHDRSAGHQAELIRRFANEDRDAARGITERAIAATRERFLYSHLAERILSRAIPQTKEAA